jgi:RHS repeat-associated protein
LPAKAFGYDALNRVVNYASGTTAQTYAYDASGNRTASTKTAPPAPSVALTYNNDKNSNRLLSIGGHWSSGYTYTETFTYDANGNTLSHTSPFGDTSYTYDARNRRTKAYAGAYATTDLINGLGQRTAQTLALSTDHFVYDGAGHLTGSYDSSGRVLDETVWLGDLPVAVLSGGQPSYIAPDHLGAPHQITIAGNRVEWLWDHDPFGNGLPTGSFSYGLRFPGQVYEQRSKLNYNYFRDYDPSTGRYIESDPIGLAGGVNTYGYAGGNPIGFFDATGLDVEVCLYPDAANGAGHIGFGPLGQPTVGFYPVHRFPDPRSILGPGDIGQDNEHPGYCKKIQASPSQDACMQSCQTSRAHNPGDYFLPTRQCTDFVRNCLFQCGLPTGPYNGPWPKDFFNNLPTSP